MRIPVALLCLFVALPASALERVELKADGAAREMLVHSPQEKGPRPVVFCYHGHGGSAELFASKVELEKRWPDSIVVYPQGLNTISRLVDPEGKRPGWQNKSGAEADRDLHFFDASLNYLKQRYPIDEKRIFALGFSNGGGFAYTLLAARGESVAAVAAIAAVQTDREDRKRMIGKPVFHVAGRNDKLVKFSWQKAMVDFLVRENRCRLIEPEHEGALKTYRSEDGAEIRFYVDGGGHEVPAASIPLIVDFFKGVY